MPLYWTQRETLAKVDWKAMPVLSLFVYEVLFGKTYYDRMNDTIKLSYDRLDPDKVALWALIKRGLDPMIEHTNKYHRKRDGFPMSKHPKHEGGSRHRHDLGIPYFMFLREYSLPLDETGEDVIDLRSVTESEYYAAHEQLESACGLKIHASQWRYSKEEEEGIFGKLPIG